MPQPYKLRIGEAYVLTSLPFEDLPQHAQTIANVLSIWGGMERLLKGILIYCDPGSSARSTFNRLPIRERLGMLEAVAEMRGWPCPINHQLIIRAARRRGLLAHADWTVLPLRPTFLARHKCDPAIFELYSLAELQKILSQLMTARDHVSGVFSYFASGGDKRLFELALHAG